MRGMGMRMKTRIRRWAINVGKRILFAVTKRPQFHMIMKKMILKIT